MAVAFANILMARIEGQILRQSCIEPHPGHQIRGFFSGAAGCFGVAAGQQIFGRRQKSLEVKPREKKLFTRVTLNGFTKPETAHKKSLATQAN